MSEPITVALAGKRHALAWHPTLAGFRLASLPGGIPNLREMANPARSLFVVGCYLWAMLPKDARAAYPDPESVMEALDESTIAAAAKAIQDAILAHHAAATAKPDAPADAKKNTPKSPRSSR